MKKKISVWICFILILIVPSTFALPVTSNTDPLPDLKIVNAEIIYTSRGWPQPIVYINNLGNTAYWNLECRLYMKKLFRNIIFYSKIDDYGASYDHQPGQIKKLNMGEFDLEEIPPLFFARIYFEVDPYNKVLESNENNNIAWTYIYGYWFQTMQWTVGAKFNLCRLR